MNNADDFGVAKAVADLLKNLDVDRQRRIVRWVSESLGVEDIAPPRSQQPLQTPPSGAGSTGGVTDIKSFMESKEPKSDNQFAAAVAYFYRFESPANERKEAITPEDLQEATRLAGRKRLGDPGKTLRNAKDMGYLDAVDRGRYAINSVGENLVAMTLSGETRGKTATTTGRKRKGRKGKR